MAGGTNNAGNGASIANSGPSQTITVNDAALVSISAAAGSAGISSTGNQTLTIQGNLSANALTLGSATSANSSFINATGNTGSSQTITVGTPLTSQSGSITIQGGVTAGKNAGIFANSVSNPTGTQTASTTGLLPITAG